MSERPYVGRFAPSPTGALHLGIARTSLAAWLDARAHGGRILLRIEDIDTPRVIPGAAEALMRELEWLGLDWDGAPMFQSARTDRYQAAIERLRARGRVYPCTCSRKDLAQLASAPQSGDEAVARYPEICRDGRGRKPGHPEATRFRTEPGDRVAHQDRLYGRLEQDVHAEVGDFVIRRSDGLFAYQLAVVVDDLEMGVTTLVRGSDLLGSTARQLVLRSELAADPGALETLHVPLLRASDGRRLAKRDRDGGVAERRSRGESAESIVGKLATSLGIVPAGTVLSARELIAEWRIDGLTRQDSTLEVAGFP